MSAIAYGILISDISITKEESSLKVLLYFEGEKLLAKSGIGRALAHQQRALTSVGIPLLLIKMMRTMISFISTRMGSIVCTWSTKPKDKGKK